MTGVTFAAPRPGSLLTPEGELLLECARSEFQGCSTRRLRELVESEIDWPALGEMTADQGVVAAVYGALSRCDASVPAAELARVRSDLTQNAARNLRLARELLALLHLFEAHGIPALPFKGVVLAQSVYGTLAARQVGDLDILVRNHDAVAARTLLQQRGYAAPGRLVGLRVIRWLEYQHELRRQADDIVIELHWRLAPRSLTAGLSFEELWARRATLRLAGSDVPVLGSEDLLVALCVHGSKHRWKRLEWICAVAELVRSTALDWDAVRERARRAKCSRMLRLGLTLVQDLFEAPLPDDLVRVLPSDAEIGALVASVRAQLPGALGTGASPALSDHRFLLHLQDDARAKLRYLLIFQLTKMARAAARLSARHSRRALR